MAGTEFEKFIAKLSVESKVIMKSQVSVTSTGAIVKNTRGGALKKLDGIIQKKTVTTSNTIKDCIVISMKTTLRDR